VANSPTPAAAFSAKAGGTPKETVLSVSVEQEENQQEY